MSAAALRARAKRYRELVDGMIRESQLARGRKLGLTRQEILEYSLVLVQADEVLGDAERLMRRAAERIDADANKGGCSREGFQSPRRPRSYTARSRSLRP